MNQEVKKEAIRQYVHYFRFWFVIVAVVVLGTIGVAVAKQVARNMPRGNSQADTERVFDYADVLSDQEENALREYIADCEKEAHIDIVIVTMNIPMGISDSEWERNMMNAADDFYDNGMYGWNKAYGDGALLLDNWYEDENGSQKGAWLSTSGKMEETIGYWEEDAVFDDMDNFIGSDPYRAYAAAVSRLAYYGEHGYDYSEPDGSFLCMAFVLPIIIALIFALSNLKQAAAKDTTVPETYVVQGKTAVKVRTDNFLRKHVTSRKIETSSGGSSGGGGHRGGGSHGSHRSSGGHSHGGGGRRR